MPTLMPLLFALLGMLLPVPVGQQSQAIPRAQIQSPHGNLNMPCENCHTFTSWRPIRSIPEFNHDKTRYPLRGMHANVSCMQCHTSLVFSNAGMRCKDCHADLHRGQFGAACEQCHTVRGWNVSLSKIQRHDNRFPLIGGHAALECDACHKNAAVGQFQGLSVNCYSCHQVQYQNAVPDHKATGFPPTCQNCHSSVDTWLGAKFDHAKFTGFALTGMHATLDCAACHVGGRYKGTPANCYGCHAKDYNATNNPNHLQAGFPHECATCHSTSTWSGAKFDHSRTKFPLTGMHTNVPCTSCHINGKFAGTPTDCASCHITDYNKTTNPNHKASGIPTTCAVCHSTNGWIPAVFDHSKTKFPLTGVHATVACTACHINGRYAGTPTDCASCHISDYNKTTNPNHKAAGFPTDCSICHSTSGWSPASFDHSKTKFPLTGKHATLPCVACHVNGNYTNLQTTCVSCHLNDYNGTTDPNHKAAGFPTDCQVCHSTSSWQGAQFDHNKTGFPLTGAHINVPCVKCHINGVYKGTPTDCYSCHKADYLGTNNPNHVAAHFPTTCATCHTTATWLGAVFNHTWFPIYSGTHAGRWMTCGDCHINSADYSAFSCITCHEHSKQNTDPHHTDVRGYVYNATSCYSCHATGQGGG
ncbi:MAG TPA: hypothetical protein VII95_00645 [Terriglobales bacterium]